MKKNKKIIIVFAIVLIIVFVVIFFVLNKKKNLKELPEDMMQFGKMDMENVIDDNFISNKSNKSDKQSKKATTLKTQTQIKSALTEKVELRAAYYLEEIYVEENQFVASGENILKYTNGKYLVAPYDCYIISFSIPDLDGKVLNSHYVEISSSNSLMVTMNIDETNISDITLGMEATIEITSLNKTYTGNITHIASTANNGKFEIEIEFENDGNVKIGMTGTVCVTI